MGADEVADSIDLALTIAGILDRLGIPYVVGGSLASSLLGEPRSTNDVDVAVEMSAEPIGDLVEAFTAEFYIDEGAVREAVRRRASFNVIHLPTVMKADIFVLGDGLLDRRQVERRRRVPVESERELWIGSAEDQVLRKLSWYRSGGEVSDQQWRDIVGVLSVQLDHLDRQDLEATAATLGLGDLLARAFREVEASP